VSTTGSSAPRLRAAAFSVTRRPAAECVNETDATIAEKGAHFIAPIPEEFTRIVTSRLEAMILPASSHAGQNAAIHSIGS